MKEAIYTKHGAMRDAEPCFMPDARGLLVVAEHKRRLSEEQGALVNLHAQRELKMQSADFAAAQDWWTNLPHTPARHLFDLEETISDILLAESIAGRWAAQFDELDGLAYIFDVAQTVNTKTGETQTEPSVFTFRGAGFERLTYPKEKNSLRYHLFFAFYEKPETLMRRISIGTDSLTAKREVINN